MKWINKIILIGSIINKMSFKMKNHLKALYYKVLALQMIRVHVEAAKSKLKIWISKKSIKTIISLAPSASCFLPRRIQALISFHHLLICKESTCHHHLIQNPKLQKIRSPYLFWSKVHQDYALPLTNFQTKLNKL